MKRFFLCLLLMSAILLPGCGGGDSTISTDTAHEYLYELQDYVSATGDTDIYLYFLEGVDRDYLDGYMEDTYRSIRNEAYQDGYSDGCYDGYEDGKESGYETGYEDAYLSDPEIVFWRNSAVIVTTTGEKYHTYGCGHIDGRRYWIYNIELAKAKGYTACLDCIDW